MNLRDVKQKLLIIVAFHELRGGEERVRRAPAAQVGGHRPGAGEHGPGEGSG